MNSRQKGAHIVLPRISAALSSFVTPITSSEQQSAIKNEEKPPFQRQKNPENQKAKPELRVISNSPEPEPQKAEVNTAPIAPNAFLQLFTLIQQKKGSLMRWLGQHYYQGALKKQKKNAKFQKGTMLDHQAE